MSDARKLLVIAGPCVIEDQHITFGTAEKLRDICGAAGVEFVFKASFDKANRTSISSFRGPGIEKGLEMLAEVKSRFGVKVLTDIHDPGQASIAANVVDILQIPAFLCRQTDLILAASDTGRQVNIKKGQFLSPWDMKNSIEKFISTGNRQLTLTDRGTCFGYNNLVVDFRSFPVMKEFGYPVLFDVTHSLQLPGGQGSCSGGQSEFAEPLAKAAIAAGADGLFMEVHPDPSKALCDGPNMIRLDMMEMFVKKMKALFDHISVHG
ncbi:MAG: 3-deoxy-8-phosphooctulonate synthase [Dissulfurispiraceae bacterium]|jgi:2-dehydro-3-deoxyphosphooctonate aldolase (KDO 8-P synthase)|nr:3-deoxy-8-phosphooctulonate synthase [Dissulfurispiraceae bacterium]